MAQPTLYFDRSTGRSLPDALKLLKLQVEHQSDGHFSADAPDDEWLAEVGRRGWYVFTHDAKFHRRGFEHEMAAIKQYEVGCFVLWGGDATRWEKMRCFAKAYDRIIEVIETEDRPFIYQIDKGGRLTKVKIP